LLSALSAALTTMLAALAGLLVLLARPLAAALLLTGALLATLLVLVRILRILAHRLLPWGPPQQAANAPNPRWFRPRYNHRQDTDTGPGHILGKGEHCAFRRHAGAHTRL
jgi:hypothetical protein